MSIRKWENVLLTSAGFFNPLNLEKPLTALIDKFGTMLDKPFTEAEVLFIPTAANNEEAKKIAEDLVIPEQNRLHIID